MQRNAGLLYGKIFTIVDISVLLSDITSSFVYNIFSVSVTVITIFQLLLWFIINFIIYFMFIIIIIYFHFVVYIHFI